MSTHAPVDDAMLVAETLAGRQEAFAEIVRRYQRPLQAAARSRVRTGSIADELVQEAFLAAFRSLRTYDSRFSFRTWLWTILLNLCRRHLARAEQRQPPPGPEIEPTVDSAGPLESLLAKERAERVATWLEALPAVQGDALRLRFFGQLKFQEVADALGCSISAAKNRVRAGLEAISDQLKHQEAAPSGDLLP